MDFTCTSFVFILLFLIGTVHALQLGTLTIKGPAEWGMISEDLQSLLKETL